MKLKLADLKTAFSLVDNVDISSVQESSQVVRITATKQKLYLHLTGILYAGASLIAPDEKWSIYVERRALKSFLSTATEEEVEITVKDKQATFKCGQTLDIPSRGAISGYENWVPTQKGSALTDEHRKIIPLLLRYCSTAPGMDQYNAIVFDKTMALASDTSSICVIGLSSPSKIILPHSVAEVVTKIAGDVKVEKDGVGILTPSGFLFQTTPDILAKYPLDQFKTLLSVVEKSPVTFTVDSDTLLNPLKAAGEFIADAVTPIQIAVNKNKAVLTVAFPSGGKFQRTITLGSSCKSELNLRWPARCLPAWLGYTSGSVLEYSRVEPSAANPDAINAFSATVGKVVTRLVFADL